MRINVYPSYASGNPIRIRKFVKNILEAQSFCDWYERNFGQKVSFVICK